MKKNNFLISYFIVFSFLMIVSRVFAATALVVGPEEGLPALGYTDLLKNHPVLIYADQQAYLGADLLDKVDAIVFFRAGWQDLALEFLPPENRILWKNDLIIPRDGSYEIYARYPDDRADKDLAPGFLIDNKPVTAPDGLEVASLRRWVHVGTTRLNRGRHTASAVPPGCIDFFLVDAGVRINFEKYIFEEVGRRKIRFYFTTDQEAGYVGFAKGPYDFQIVFAGKPKEERASLWTFQNKEIALRDMFCREKDLSRVFSGTATLSGHDGIFRLSSLSAARPKWIVFSPSEDMERKTAAAPFVSFQRISPVKYIVSVQDAKTPFWLVFSEGYNELWRLYRDDLKASSPWDMRDIRFLGKPFLKAKHYRLNAYANGWYVDPGEEGLPASFSLVLFFWPQAWFYLGLVISAIAFSITGVFLLWRR
jgi:hypothetical protein